MSDELPFKNELVSGTRPAKSDDDETPTTEKPKKKRLKKKSSGLKKKNSGLTSDTGANVKGDTPKSLVKIDPKTGTNVKKEGKLVSARSRVSGASGSSSTSSSSSRSNGRIASASTSASPRAVNGASKGAKNRTVAKI